MRTGLESLLLTAPPSSQKQISKTEAYSEPCQTSKMEHFAKAFLDIWQGSEYASKTICIKVQNFQQMFLSG